MVNEENCGTCGNQCGENAPSCESGTCVNKDQDNDGYTAKEWGGDDCDDNNESVYPGASEICDALDNNCNGMTDELPDADLDCDDSNDCTDDECVLGACTNSNLNDIGCDDGDACTSRDTCRNGVCSGEMRDDDCDGFVSVQCGGDDCNDDNREINTGEIEDSSIRFVCSDGIDNDCDGLTDSGENGCCEPDCTGNECGDGGCIDQPVACGTCQEGYWCNNGACEELTSELVWVYIPSGTFMMGSNEGYYDERPVHQVNVPAFYMTMTEVTVSQYEQCVISGACEDFDNCWEYCNWRGPPGLENHPINCISWYQSVDYCTWAGGRLPSESEWEYAARSAGRDVVFPWGDQRPTCDLAVHDPGCHKGECCPADCIDTDQDGYGMGSDCLGPDCNDSNPICSYGDCCIDCIDVDGDGYGIGQDCLGEDCNDTDPRYWENGCGAWKDLDGDRYGRGSIWQGPDCNDSDPDCHEGECCSGCIDIDGDGYGIGDCCLGHDCVEGADDFLDNSGCRQNRTWPVCSKPAGNTDHGLCDMTGNVSEWVQDWYHDNYEGAPTDGSAWGNPVVNEKVLRGSAWDTNRVFLRVHRRSSDIPDTSLCEGLDWKGLRCARDQ